MKKNILVIGTGSIASRHIKNILRIDKSSTIDDISDNGGWERVRDDLILNIGLNRVPIVFVMEMKIKSKTTI